ncbi:MAG TPA: hypothetical protein VHL58_09365 [Thermoanaerobaculia bacterium]|nr:hypothetical protein [Thermoanaerobaculia bacterium]
MHPETRELIGEIAYGAVVFASIAILIRFLPVTRLTWKRALGRTAIALVVAMGAGYVIAEVVNSTWDADFCIYLILGVATMGGVLTAMLLPPRPTLQRYGETILIAVAALEILVIPMFLLGQWR